MAGPLSGIRVLDLTTVLAGPFGTQMLGDMGADIVKIEPPAGDVSRWLGPMRSAGMGPRYLHLNRNKRSVVLDLKTEAGREALLSLCETADVLVYNVRPAAMKRLGLDYETVEKINPKLVYCGIVGFSQDGPYADKPAYDDILQAGLGIPLLQQAVTGVAPSFYPGAIIDQIAGLTAAYAISAALVARSRTGRGDAIEVPMFEMMGQFVLSEHMNGHTFEPPMGELGFPRLLSSERRPYPTRDGYLFVLPYTDAHCGRLFELIGQPELLDDERFSSTHGRATNASAFNAILSKVFGEKTSAEWMALLDAADVPAMPLNDLSTLMKDPHLEATGFFERFEHPSEGRLVNIRVPTRWTHSQPEHRYPAPRLGEHTDEILREVGLAP